MAFPKKARFVVIGAGIHGLSTAWHLAEKLKKKNGNATNNDIVVIDKGKIASGASGIACGVVRNNYFQPAMRELMMHSVKMWESDPKNFNNALKKYEVKSRKVDTNVEVGKIDGHQKRIGAKVVKFPFYDPEKLRVKS